MNWAEFVVQWLHILLGTFWFGGILFSNFIIIPAIMRLASDRQGEIVHNIAAQGQRIIPAVAIGTILLGVVRGTVFGDIKDLAGLGTAYGIWWLIGLIAAVATFAWGTWVLSPAAERITAGGPADSAALGRVKMYALLELVGFFVIFTTMILMHFAGEA